MGAVFRDLMTSGVARRPDAPHLRQFVSAGLALLTAVVVASPPFKQSDWPAPKRPNIPQASTVLGGSLPLTTAQTLPFSAKDWPAPKLPKIPQAQWTFAESLPLVTAKTLPFGSWDWPLARRPLLSAPESPALNIAAIRTVVATAAPFASFDWPLAKRRPTLTPETPPLNVAALRTIVIGPQPFALMDWPLAQKPRLASLVGPSSTLLPQAGIPVPPIVDIDRGGGWRPIHKGKTGKAGIRKKRGARDAEDAPDVAEMVTADNMLIDQDEEDAIMLLLLSE